jgi:transposase
VFQCAASSLPQNNQFFRLWRAHHKRKNWLFVGSDDGGRVNATFTTLLASCRMLGVEPWSYLRDLLCLLPRWPAHRVLELAPLHWPATSTRDDVKASLADNPYWSLTLLG